MAGNEDIKEFPDVNHKLSAPKKLSAFEKERQAVEAKRQRAEAENAAALKEFEDSFGGDDDSQSYGGGSGRGMPGALRGSSGRYGMPPSGPRAGPGSFGAGHGLPPPPSLKRKRALEEMREAQEARREQTMLGFENAEDDAMRTPQASVEDEEREIEVPKPTVHLSSIPPGTSTEEIKTLLGGLLKVHSIRFLPPAGPGSVGKRSLAAIATLASEMSATQIDTAVSSLRDRYMGSGFYLSISRHLSSTALHPTTSGTTSSASSEPFGARSTIENRPRHSMRNAPPPHDQRGFAPPEYYDRRGPSVKGAETQVSVQPPLDITTIRAVHTIADRLLSEKDPERAVEMEALLMGLPEVQKDERFAFLYDSKSPAGVYYRFCLWSPDSIDEEKRQARRTERIFGDMDMDWLTPYKEVPFPNLTSLSEVVTDLDYVSSDEESDDDEAERRMNQGPEAEANRERSEKTHLTPLQRARLTYLLSRLPITNTRLRKGDVARITSFAINHAGGGAEEVVDMLLLNVEKPLSYLSAANYEELNDDNDEKDDDEYEPGETLPTIETQPTPPSGTTKQESRENDPSNAKLVALYVISDILSASSTAGARNAWKYRQLFEAGFRHLKTFERLGKLDRELGWGRLRAEQWKRRISAIFEIWENWSAFSSEVCKQLKRSFYEPPLTEEEKLETAKMEDKADEQKWMNKFKRVDQSASATASPAPALVAGEPPVVEGNTTDNVDVVHVGVNLDGALPDVVNGKPLGRAGDADGAPLADIDGAPLADIDGAPLADLDGKPIAAPTEVGPMNALEGAPNTAAADPLPAEAFSLQTQTQAPAKPTARRRMRAEDMFADSDED